MDEWIKRPQRSPQSFYIAKAELSRMIRECQAAGKVSDELAIVVHKIAGGLIAKYHASFVTSADEYWCRAFCILAKVLPRLDPDKNCFGYLTQCIKNDLFQEIRTAANRAKYLVLDSDPETAVERHRRYARGAGQWHDEAEPK